MELEGRVALVTGGTSGIGAATAELFAREGAAVVITGRRQQRAMEVIERIEAAGGQASWERADHTRAEDCERAVAAALALHGRIDVLFNNAGVVTDGTAETTSEESWSRTLDLNVTAVWRMCRAVIPHMREAGGGAIVNNASDWAVVGARNAFAYATSKAAVAQMTRCMALDHARDRIRVNAVCPGDTFVDRWLDREGVEPGDAEGRERMLAELGAPLPLGRVGRPEEIAQAVLYLASDRASFTTGALLVVDGGNTAGGIS